MHHNLSEMSKELFKRVYADILPKLVSSPAFNWGIDINIYFISSLKGVYVTSAYRMNL